MYTVVVGHTKEDDGITDDITNDVVEFVTTNGVDEFATYGVLGATVVALVTNR